MKRWCLFWKNCCSQNIMIKVCFCKYFENSFWLGLPKFRVSTSKPQVGTVKPVIYDIVDYNHGMVYHNGIVLIIEPGWYSFTTNSRGADNNSASQTIGLHIAVNNSGKSYAERWIQVVSIPNEDFFSYGRSTVTTTYSGYFNQFDFVQVYKGSWVSTAPSRGHVHNEWFEGRMIPWNIELKHFGKILFVNHNNESDQKPVL